MKTFEVTRAWRYDGYEGGIEESLVLVDGQQIGGVYAGGYNPAQSIPGWGLDDGGESGENWISWGPRGLSCGHASREAAEIAQVREYAANPDLYDRLNAVDRDERAAEAAKREAEIKARYDAWEAERRRERLGDDEPGPVVWTLPAYHALYADLPEVTAVGEWAGANGAENVSAIHEVRVEQRATRRAIVFESPASRQDGTETWVVTLKPEPPEITTPPRPDLHGLLDEHWPARFPLIDYGLSMACGKCTREAKATTEAQMVSWPCPVVASAISNAPEAVA
jgi:hypothetical protein